jgi:hypothetical protein
MDEEQPLHSVRIWSRSVSHFDIYLDDMTSRKT